MGARDAGMRAVLLDRFTKLDAITLNEIARGRGGAVAVEKFAARHTTTAPCSYLSLIHI